MRFLWIASRCLPRLRRDVRTRPCRRLGLLPQSRVQEEDLESASDPDLRLDLVVFALLEAESCADSYCSGSPRDDRGVWVSMALLDFASKDSQHGNGVTLRERTECASDVGCIGCLVFGRGVNPPSQGAPAGGYHRSARP